MDGHGHYLGRQFSFTKVFSLSSPLMIALLLYGSASSSGKMLLALVPLNYIAASLTLGKSGMMIMRANSGLFWRPTCANHGSRVVLREFSVAWVSGSVRMSSY